MDPYLISIPLRQRSVGIIIFIVGIGCIILAGVFFLLLAPLSAPKTQIVTIPAGSTITTAGKILESNHVIASRILYRIALFGRGTHAGDYEFTKPYTFFSVVRRTVHGDFGKSQVRLTVTEGSTVREIATELKKILPQFDDKQFIIKATAYEGKLFPDTYYFFWSVTPDAVIDRMTGEFEKNVTPILRKASVSRPDYDVLIMASILEKEASNAAEAKTIAGILYKRIAKGMPLQVDATFKYTLGKTSSELTVEDLAKDGPYNTYTRKGLPPTPIGNPGIAMIEAALYPVESPYWYYLHDTNGEVHYAATYDEHVTQKAKYLK